MVDGRTEGSGCKLGGLDVQRSMKLLLAGITLASNVEGLFWDESRMHVRAAQEE
jgi:hypothetical protein